MIYHGHAHDDPQSLQTRRVYTAYAFPLNALFDAPPKVRLHKAVSINDLRLCANQRAHKVCGAVTVSPAHATDP